MHEQDLLLIYSQKQCPTRCVSKVLEYGLVGVNKGLISKEARLKLDEAHLPNYSHTFAYIC